MSCDVDRRYKMSWVSSGSIIGGTLFFLPQWKYHLLSLCCCSVPLFGFGKSGVKIVAGALLSIQDGRPLDAWVRILVGVAFGL